MAEELEPLRERSERSAEARARFCGEYTAELERARAKGYTEEHDHEHGPQHLLDWATEYIYRGEPIKAAAMIAAARALLACAIPEHHRRRMSSGKARAERCAACDAPATGTAWWGAGHGRQPSCGEHGDDFRVFP